MNANHVQIHEIKSTCRIKTPKEKSFIAQVNGFIYIVGEEDQVEFDWLTESVFPTDTEYRQWFTRQKDRTSGGNMRYILLPSQYCNQRV